MATRIFSKNYRQHSRGFRGGDHRKSAFYRLELIFQRSEIRLDRVGDRALSSGHDSWVARRPK